MADKKIRINKKNLKSYSIIFVILAIILIYYLYNYSLSVITISQNPETETLEAKFALLSKANSNSCGGTFNYVDSMPGDARIQGSCCSRMDFHRYSEQIDGLKKYSDYEIIPKDSYDVPVSVAQEMLDYQKNIVLTEEQQEVYDEAMEISHEGGPCCCKCWHWYAYEGLAKYLIVEEDFTAEQIAEVWDLSDACGGNNHVHGDSEGH